MFNVIRTINKRPANIVVKSKKSGSKNNKKRMSDCITENHYSKYKIEGLNKNFFTDLIDKMMMDEFFDEKFKVKFENVCKTRPDKKRLAILGKIDNGKGIIADLKALKDNFVPKMTHIEDIITMLRRYVKYGIMEKTKEFGEVATPLELVRDMVKSIPDDNDDIWSNPYLKWLDPCNGTGPFLSMVIRKLMKGLENWQPNEEVRYKHIVENMIYCCEIQPKNMFLWMFFADPYDQYLLNVYPDSYLDEGFDKHMKNIWGIDKFDVIIGNPPYQDNTGNVGTGHTLWDKFVLKSTSLLNKNGYINFVHPSGWRNISGSFDKVKKEMMKMDVMYLEIHNISDGLKTFGAATRYDCYILRNSYTKDLLTKIIDEDGNTQEMDVKKLKYIPNKMFDMFLGLTAKENEEKVCILQSESMYEPRKKWMNAEKTDEFIYPCVKYISKKDYSMDFRYSKENRGMFGIPKVFFGMGAQVGGILIDKNGEYGQCQFVASIADKPENLENIKKALESDKFKKLMESCQFTTQAYNKKIIETFRKDFWKDFI